MKKPIKDNDGIASLNDSLIDELRRKKLITPPHIEAAFRAVPRHLFLPQLPPEEVYVDKALALKKNEAGRWISSSSQPAMMAIMLEQLDLQPGHKVLEIGAGSGYNAALMAHIVGQAGRVFTVDIDEDLAGQAQQHLGKAGFNQVKVICADGGYGFPDEAPYDRIILSVRPADIIPSWSEQLKVGGRLVLPLEIKRPQLSIAFDKLGDHLTSRSTSPCGFMILRGEFAEALPDWVQLGPDPDLLLDRIGLSAADPDLIYRLLTKPSWDLTSGIEITAREFFDGLGLWLMLHEPRLCILAAQGDMVEQNIVPPLLRVNVEQNTVSTTLLPGDSGLAALMQAPDPAASTVMSDPHSPERSFQLLVRQFGPDASAAHRLLGLLKSWDNAGRPSTRNLRVRAYPREANYKAAAHEFVVTKRWSDIVLDWPREMLP